MNQVWTRIFPCGGLLLATGGHENLKELEHGRIEP